MDAAVLLNLTGNLSFEATDPLMSVVNVGKPLLFYDRLSVEKFPIDDAALCQQHVERLASSMRNLLEARSLSAEDNNQRIRLIITLDLAGGAFTPENASKKFFPAQKVRQFKNMVERIFEKGNPLLNRFDYCFIFLASNTDMDDFYQLLAYDGYSGLTADEWIGRDNISLNDFRNKIILEMNNPEEEWPLTRKEIEASYQKFLDKLHSVKRKVADRMEEAGLRSEFATLIDDKLSYITTIGDFNKCDYDHIVLSCISQLIGLCADNFKKDCTFFLVHTDNNKVSEKRKYETFVASLIQLLATINQNDYDTILKTNDLDSPARFFLIGNLANDCFNKDAFALLEEMVKECCSQLQKARWERDRKVTYYLYSSKTEDPSTIDTHRQLNDKFAEQRQMMYNEFAKERKVPFFFGKRIGDWSWYKRVVKCIEEIYHFESINDRPLYDPLYRITDDKIDREEIECTYADLENEIDTLPKEAREIKKVKDLNIYLRERRDLMGKLGDAIKKAKNEMVKLGYLSCLMWIGIFSTLGFTLTYTYHFFWYDNEDSNWLIAICFGISALLFLISAIVGQACVKSKIKDAYFKIDEYYNKMQSNLRDYLDEVSLRAKLQNEADIRRKNMDEMKSKLDAFNRHNGQVDIWLTHFKGVNDKLSKTFELLKFQQNKECQKSIDFDDNDFDLVNASPSLPEVIRHHFTAMTTSFSNREIAIGEVTSFVTHYRFSEEQQ